jgi:uncharacterized protein (DUF58 family)
MTLRRTFWIVLLVLAGAVFGALTARSDIYSRLAYFCIGLMVFSGIWTYFSVRGIEITRYAKGFRQQLGQVFEERYEIQNQYKLIRFLVEIKDGSELPVPTGSRVLSWIEPQEIRKFSAYTLLTQRGEFKLGPTIVSSGDPFGLFGYQKIVAQGGKLVVLPHMVNIHYFPFPPGLLPGGRALRRKTHEVTPHAAGVREYASGDSISRIHWVSTARRNQLMVKEFEQDPQSDVWIFLDGHKNAHYSRPLEVEGGKVDKIWLWRHRFDITLPLDTFEYSVSAAASISNFFIRDGQAVGLACAAQILTVLSAEKGIRQQDKILETLAFVRCAGKLPLLGLVQAQLQHLQRGSTVVLITASAQEGVILAAQSLLSRNLRPVIVFVDQASFGGSISVKEMAISLRNRNFPVVLISHGDDLGQALEQSI